MHCPRCDELIWAGDHPCHCGRYYFHAWTGGGVLLGRLGSWRYSSEEGSWQPLAMPEVLPPAVVAEEAAPVTPGGHVVQVLASGLREIVVPVVIQIQL